MNSAQAQTFAEAMMHFGVSLDQATRVCDDATRAMDTFRKTMDRIVAADIAALNDTQRAIYRAYQRAGLCHFEIMRLL